MVFQWAFAGEVPRTRADGYSRGMADQIVLEWEIDTTGTPLGGAQAALVLGAVSLYTNAVTDPVLGQLLGLTVDSDIAAASGASTATRTLTLNMNAANNPTAPPPFPCLRSTPGAVVLPYVLNKPVPLEGSFFVSNGSAIVLTTQYQGASIEVGTPVQFLSQPGAVYVVGAVDESSITLTAVYTGTSSSTGAFKVVPDPVTLAAFYSTANADTAGVATTPAIPAGSGAHEIELTYRDSTGGGPFSVIVELTGKRPAMVELDPASVDIAEIVNIVVNATGDFENNVGQITLAGLSAPIPDIRSDAVPEDFPRITDEAQALINRWLAYLPPSYFALSQQGAGQDDPPSPPTNAQLSVLLGQFVSPATVGPLPPPIPTFLSGYFTRTLELALAGVKVTPKPIVFLP
jgi:hypothetical protein